MSKKLIFFLIAATTLVNLAAIDVRHSYALADAGMDKLCTIVSHLMFVAMFLLIAKINLSAEEKNQKTALLATFGAGMFGMTVLDDLFSLALK